MKNMRRRPTPNEARTETEESSQVTLDSELIQRFSHQLRSLLTSVGAAADYLLNNEIERGVRDEMLGIIAEQATRIDGLLDDFLVIASSHPGGGGTPSAVNLYQITRKVVRDLAGEAQSVGAWLVLDTAGSISPVLGHHQPLQQAITSALRAVLSVTRPGERVIARLEDTRGDGGEKLIQFSVTVQSDDHDAGDRTGRFCPTDLALEAASRISEQHGGAFEVLEDRLGIACLLPVASLELQPAAALREGRRIEACGP